MLCTAVVAKASISVSPGPPQAFSMHIFQNIAPFSSTHLNHFLVLDAAVVEIHPQAAVLSFLQPSECLEVPDRRPGSASRLGVVRWVSNSSNSPRVLHLRPSSLLRLPMRRFAGTAAFAVAFFHLGFGLVSDRFGFLPLLLLLLATDVPLGRRTD